MKTLLCIFMLAYSGLAYGGEVQIEPAASVILTNPTDATDEVMLIRFTLPTGQGRILRATLVCPVAAQDGKDIVAWADPAPIQWTRELTTWPQWLVMKSLLSEKEGLVFEATGEGGLEFDISRWVRAWDDGTRTNFGVALRRVAGASGTFSFKAAGGLSKPTLRVVYRAAKPPIPTGGLEGPKSP